MVGERKDNKSKMAFKNQYDGLLKDEKLYVRDRIIAESGMSLPTFYYKLRMEKWKPLEQELCSRIINELENARKVE